MRRRCSDRLGGLRADDELAIGVRRGHREAQRVADVCARRPVHDLLRSRNRMARAAGGVAAQPDERRRERKVAVERPDVSRELVPRLGGAGDRRLPGRSGREVRLVDDRERVVRDRDV